ncbi:MAG: hypothetical protein JF621_15210 [Streptomyces turgidiscabies]|nr:hypothetical protein [Streptomyces turgidiscabies]
MIPVTLSFKIIGTSGQRREFSELDEGLGRARLLKNGGATSRVIDFCPVPGNC